MPTGQDWRQNGGSGVRARSPHSLSVMILVRGESIFFDQLVKLLSEQGGIVQPDVPVWLLMISRAQAAALDLSQK